MNLKSSSSIRHCEEQAIWDYMIVYQAANCRPRNDDHSLTYLMGGERIIRLCATYSLS